MSRLEKFILPQRSCQLHGRVQWKERYVPDDTRQKVSKNLKQVEVWDNSDQEEEEEEEVQHDEETCIATSSSFIDQHASKILNAVKVALTTPVLLIVGAAIGVSLNRISFRCNVFL